MAKKISELDLKPFYPEELFDFTNCIIDKSGIQIYLKSKRQGCECPKCHQISHTYHGTYKRTIQDLPILGRNVTLIITAHEYQCTNEDCETRTIVERFDHFLGYYGRFTERCEDLIATLALETSCEGAARVCMQMGIQISGDTIIRLLKKRFSQMETEMAGSCIGIDDFSTKKGYTYCTIICNENTHKPIAVLDGRDGKSLAEWLRNNKQVRTVTRDRASAYAKAIKNELPDAMQIADRFHLHQNFLDIIKKCIADNLPRTLRVTQEPDSNEETSIIVETGENSEYCDEECKKNRTHCG